MTPFEREPVDARRKRSVLSRAEDEQMGIRVYYTHSRRRSGRSQAESQRPFITFSDFETALEWAAYVALNSTDILAVETPEGGLLGCEQIGAALAGRRRARVGSQ
jgi:hypothetical protein